MKKLLFVIPDLEYNGVARQMLYLATGLPRDRFELRVCVLGEAGPWRDELIRSGIPVDVLGRHRSLDVKPLLALRSIIRSFQPDIVHAWRIRALRAVLFSKIGTSCRLIASSTTRATSPGIGKAFLDSLLLRRTDNILAGSAHEVQVLESLGVSPRRIVRVAPAVAAALVPEFPSIRAALGLAPDTRLIACVGPLRSEKGFRDAIWALDILHYVIHDIHLLLLGTGPALDQLRHFAHTLMVEKFVHFLGPQEYVIPLLTQVDMVWVPSHRNSGVNAALEAMAAGRPVVATQMPVLAELFPPAAQSSLVASQDQGSLARQTRLLLDDAEGRSSLGEEGRKHVAERHSLEGMVEKCIRLYEESSG